LVFTNGGRTFLLLYGALLPLFVFGLTTYPAWSSSQSLLASSGVHHPLTAFLFSPYALLPFAPIVLLGVTGLVLITVKPILSKSGFLQAITCAGNAFALYILIISMVAIGPALWIFCSIAGIVAATIVWIFIRFGVEILSLWFKGRFSIKNFLLLLIVFSAFLTLAATVQKNEIWWVFFYVLVMSLLAGTPILSASAFFCLTVGLPIGEDREAFRFFCVCFAIAGFYLLGCWIWLHYQFQTLPSELGQGPLSSWLTN